MTGPPARRISHRSAIITDGHGHAWAAEPNGGSGVSRNSKVTTQRGEGALHRVAWSRCLAADAKAARGLKVLVYRRDSRVISSRHDR
jgi:hypothetical protein